MVRLPAGEVAFEDGACSGFVNRSQPPARQLTMLPVARRVLLASSVLEGRPAESGVRFFDHPVITESRKRQRRKKFFVDHSFEQARRQRAPLRNDGRTLRSDADQPVDGGLLAGLQNLNAFRLD